MVETGFDADQVRRAVIQQLEGLRRAGVTHWKRIEPVTLPSVAPAVDSSPKLATPTLETGKATSLFNETAPTPVREKTSPSAAPNAGVPAQPATSKVSPVSRPPFQALNLSRPERIAGLEILRDQVKNCTRCPELASTRTQTVFGVGNPEARILFVGEAPGADEDAQGEPFVGKSGQLLNDIIKACRLRREDIYICNVLRCRPPGNRLPAPDECANCREFLDGQIAHVNPDYIVCWGACAAQNLLSSTETIGKLRRRFFTFGNAKVICTYHPSYLMRNPSAKKDVWEDMKMLFLDMGIDLTKKP